LVRARRPSEDTSEDELPVKGQKNTVSPVREVGYMAGLFTFIESFPNAPSLLAKYLQLFFNSAIILGCLYAIYSFWTTIQTDVNRASEDAAAETLAEMAACAKSYVDNRCAGDSRLPALETVCNNWELCMNRDPNSVKRAKLSAHTFAEILNSFVEPISLKTMVGDCLSHPSRAARRVCNILYRLAVVAAIDHRTWNTGLPVRSDVLKPCAGQLVVGWVTTSEYWLLIVFVLFPVVAGTAFL
jgi:Di-sulfide bridge nucleocytoplasmic transport domain